MGNATPVNNFYAQIFQNHVELRQILDMRSIYST